MRCMRWAEHRAGGVLCDLSGAHEPPLRAQDGHRRRLEDAAAARLHPQPRPRDGLRVWRSSLARTERVIISTRAASVGGGTLILLPGQDLPGASRHHACMCRAACCCEPSMRCSCEPLAQPAARAAGSHACLQVCAVAYCQRLRTPSMALLSALHCRNQAQMALRRPVAPQTRLAVLGLLCPLHCQSAACSLTAQARTCLQQELSDKLASPCCCRALPFAYDVNREPPLLVHSPAPPSALPGQADGNAGASAPQPPPRRR
jgi:hypothetical protein